MSEPLYRIWSIQAQQYVHPMEGYYINLNGDILNMFYRIKSEDYIIQRCTGEQDVNGKYIYQGDIVEYDIRKRFEEGRKRGVVEYFMSRLYVRQLNNGNNYDIDRFSKYTIIGNNLENPELLLEKEEE